MGKERKSSRVKSRVKRSRVKRSRVKRSRVKRSRVKRSRVKRSRVKRSRVKRSRVKRSRVKRSRVKRRHLQKKQYGGETVTIELYPDETLGINFKLGKGERVCHVDRVTEGSIADENGVVVGDYLLSMNGEDVGGGTINEMIAKKGKRNAKPDILIFGDHSERKYSSHSGSGCPRDAERVRRERVRRQEEEAITMDTLPPDIDFNPPPDFN